METQTLEIPHCGLCRIELDHVSVRLDNETLLSDVNLHVHCGQLTVLIGPNGGGKTTLLRAVLGQVPHEGTISHLDRQSKPFPSMRVGYVPQQLLFDRQMPLTVRDLLASSIAKRPVWTGVSKKTRDRATTALELAQAQSLIDKRLGALSGGELQRVLLALALTPAPDLLLLDEPVSGVDHNGQALFLDTVNALRAQQHAILRQLERAAGGNLLQHVEWVALAIEMPGNVQADQVDVTYLGMGGAEGADFAEQVGESCCCHGDICGGSGEDPEHSGG